MGNSHGVPREGGERLSDFLRRLFKGKTRDADKLVAHALIEEQKQRQKEEKKRKGLWKRIKNRFTPDDKTNGNVTGNAPDDFLSFLSSIESRRKTKANTENIDSVSPENRDNFQQWRNHQENVISSTRATTTDRQESETLHKPDPALSTSSSVPRRVLRSGNSPIFQFNIPVKFGLRISNSDLRGVRQMAKETHPPWTHKDYGSEPWAEDTLDYAREKAEDIAYHALKEAEEKAYHAIGKAEDTAYCSRGITEETSYRNRRSVNNVTGMTESTEYRPRGRAEDTDYCFRESAENTAYQVRGRAEDTDYCFRGSAEETINRIIFADDISYDARERTEDTTYCSRETAEGIIYRTIYADDISYYANKRTEDTAYCSKCSAEKTPSNAIRDRNTEYRTRVRAKDTAYLGIRADDKAYHARGRAEETDYRTRGTAEETAYRTTGRAEDTEYLTRGRAEDATYQARDRAEDKAYFSRGIAEETAYRTTGSANDRAYRVSGGTDDTTSQNHLPKQDQTLPLKLDIHKQPENSSVDSSRDYSVHNYLPTNDPGYDKSKPDMNKRKAQQAVEDNKGQSSYIDTNEVTSEKRWDSCVKPAVGATKPASIHMKNTAKESKDEKNVSVTDVNTQPTKKTAEAFFASFGSSNFNGSDDAVDAKMNSAKIFLNKGKQNIDKPILKENNFVNGDDTNAKMKTCFNAGEIETKEKTDDVLEKISLDYPYASLHGQCTDRKQKPDKNQTENEGHSCCTEDNPIKKEEHFVITAFDDSTSRNKNRPDRIAMETSKEEKRVDKGDDIEDNTQKNNEKAEAFFVSLGPSTFNANDHTEDVKNSFSRGFPNKGKHHSPLATLNESTKRAEAKDCVVKNKQESTFSKRDNTDIPIKTKHGVDDNSSQEKPDTQSNSRKAEAFFVSFGPSTLDAKDHAEDIKESFKKRFPNKVKPNTHVTFFDEMPIKKAGSLFMPTLEETEYGSEEHHNKIKTDNAIRKTNVTRLSRKPSQYGSVEHNNLIKTDNALRKKKIESATTKVDSWKTNETDDSYLHLNMRNYKLSAKPAQYGSVAHNNQIKLNNAMRKKKIGNITTTLDTWKTNETDNNYLHPNMRDYEVVKRPAEYGSVEHNNQIKRDNAMRKKRMGKIQSGLDTWNAPNPGSKYSLKRRDEWEPILDPGKYGSVAHFHQIKYNNATRKKRLNKIHSNLDTWNTTNPGSRYSLKRKDEWEPVYDTRKYGSVAHYHQVKQTHADNRHMLKAASTKLSTWQPKSKMNLLNISHQKKTETEHPNMKSLKASLNGARSRIDTGTNDPKQNNHSLSSWSRHVPVGKVRDDITVLDDDNWYSSTEHAYGRTKSDYDPDLSYRNKHEPENTLLDRRNCLTTMKSDTPDLTNQDNDQSFSLRRRHIPPETSRVNGQYQTSLSGHLKSGTSPDNRYYQQSRRRQTTNRISPVSEEQYQPDMSYRNKHGLQNTLLDRRNCLTPIKRDTPRLTNQDNDQSFSLRRRHIPPETPRVKEQYQTSLSGHVTSGTSPDNRYYQQSQRRQTTNQISPVSEEQYQPSWSRPVSCRTACGKRSLIPVPKENPVSRYEQMLRGVLRQNQK